MSAICYCGRPECPVVESIHPDKCHAFEVERLRADNARLRSNLEWCEANWTKAAFARGAGLPMIRATLASSDAAQWLRERERRVAEAVIDAVSDAWAHRSCTCWRHLQTVDLAAIVGGVP